VAAILLSYHNVYYMMRLMRTLRESIIDGTLPEFVQAFMRRMYPSGRNPEWAEEALLQAGIPLGGAQSSSGSAEHERPPKRAKASAKPAATEADTASKATGA
jgi:hypothetical protein